MEKKSYIAPIAEIYEIMAEGVLCASTANEGVGEGMGNGDFN